MSKLKTEVIKYSKKFLDKFFTLKKKSWKDVIDIKTSFNNLPKKLTCGGMSISEYDMEIPSNLTAEEILIRSGNIGSIRICLLYTSEAADE